MWGLLPSLVLLAISPTLAARVPPKTPAFKLLYAFKSGTDGEVPYTGLIRDAAGTLYGTTAAGGLYGLGTIFQVDKAGTETVLYSFTGESDGGIPQFSKLILDAGGNLYGTTSSRYGTVFRLNRDRSLTVLYTFSGPDGASPSLAFRDAAGTFYGICGYGGAHNYGVVFKLDSSGKEIALYNFWGGADGGFPNSGLVRDDAGNFYGTTSTGGTGYGYGAVFRLDKNGKEVVLHRFAGDLADGKNPYAGLVRDPSGNLYGTTYGSGAYGYGTVFRIDRAGKETILHNFAGGTDGKHPFSGVILDRAGNLYGTTLYGGTLKRGIVFKLEASGRETVLHSFTGLGGKKPREALILDAAGNLYGTTPVGGAPRHGTVFKLTSK